MEGKQTMKKPCMAKFSGTGERCCAHVITMVGLAFFSQEPKRWCCLMSLYSRRKMLRVNTPYYVLFILVRTYVLVKVVLSLYQANYNNPTHFSLV
jgi:hypothetical protein